MRDMIEWSPYRELQRMRDEFGGFFGPGSLMRWPEQLIHSVPSADVSETDTHVIVTAEVPGVDPDDLDVTITDESLTIRGEVRQEQDTSERGFRRMERQYGSFHRVIPFPVSVKHDEAVATCRNGVLEVRAPKAEPGRGRAVRLRIDKGQAGSH